jgi:ATP-dependent Clp protease ATP-binding subunit ClpB
MKIVDLHIGELANRLKEKDLGMEVDKKVISFLAKEGFDPDYGARPVRRVVQEKIEDGIAENMLSGAFKKGDTIKVVMQGKDKIDFMHAEKKKTPTRKPRKTSKAASTSA